MRLITVVLIGLVVLIQYPLWWGHGGWLHVHELEQQLQDQRQKNAELQLRNDRLTGEVEDLRNGTAALEERARYELGMLKDDEVFVQFVSPNSPTPANVTAITSASEQSTRGQMSAEPIRVVPDPPPRPPRKKREAAVHKQKVAR